MLDFLRDLCNHCSELTQPSGTVLHRYSRHSGFFVLGQFSPGKQNRDTNTRNRANKNTLILGHRIHLGILDWGQVQINEILWGQGGREDRIAYTDSLVELQIEIPTSVQVPVSFTDLQVKQVQSSVLCEERNNLHSDLTE